MKALFLSDAHLRGTDGAAYGKILGLLERIRGRGEAVEPQASVDPLIIDLLVIAGDFFDFWFSRGEVIYPGFRLVVERIAALKREGVRVVLCEGNHDFFLGDYFTGRLGIEVAPDAVELDIDGLRVLVSHGDTVDRDNLRYLALRKFLRSPFAFRLQRALPLEFLWRLARFSSELSNESSEASQDRLAAVMQRFAQGKFREGYDAVILGHCHKPLLRDETVAGKAKTFATLGDWNGHDTFLLYADGRFSLERLARRQ
ncbi:MAG: UDP-2,3-diacylglucosamine diphosphatase [Deltaproteobacteria bacterium]|nr:UDP-2,3-diacylglucosamine diphosphatase [Deltaproteobacteria bacterium]